MLYGHPSITKVTRDNNHRFKTLKLGQRAYTESGVNFGKTPYVVESLPDPVKGPYHIICVPGHTGWSGVGDTSYYETHYSILEERIGGPWKCHTHDRKFGKKWKNGIKELREEVKALMRGTTKAHEKTKAEAKSLGKHHMQCLETELLELEAVKLVYEDTITTLTKKIKALNDAHQKLGRMVYDTDRSVHEIQVKASKCLKRIREIKETFALRKEK
jgi:hypothetical protein